MVKIFLKKCVEILHNYCGGLHNFKRTWKHKKPAQIGRLFADVLNYNLRLLSPIPFPIN